MTTAEIANVIRDRIAEIDTERRTLKEAAAALEGKKLPGRKPKR